MSSKKELRQLQRLAEAQADEFIKTERLMAEETRKEQQVAEAQGKLLADERIKMERLMAEKKRKVLWSLSLD